MNTKTIIKPLAIVFIAFFLSLLLTSPKLSMFYKLEHTLSEKKINMNTENATNFFLFLKLNNLKLNSATNKILDSKDSYFFTSYVYSGYYLTSPKLSDATKALIPMEINSIYASNSIFAPSIVNLRVVGSFGYIYASIDAKSGTIKARLELSKDFESEPSSTSVKNALMIKFKQTEEGLIYESTI